MAGKIRSQNVDLSGEDVSKPLETKPVSQPQPQRQPNHVLFVAMAFIMLYALILLLGMGGDTQSRLAWMKEVSQVFGPSTGMVLTYYFLQSQDRRT